jgi:hypothetical protein
MLKIYGAILLGLYAGCPNGELGVNPTECSKSKNYLIRQETNHNK